MAYSPGVDELQMKAMETAIWTAMVYWIGVAVLFWRGAHRAHTGQGRVAGCCDANHNGRVTCAEARA